MAAKTFSVALVDYPGALKSSLFGFEEIFSLANGLCEQEKLSTRFSTRIITVDEIEQQAVLNLAKRQKTAFGVVILPPGIQAQTCFQPGRKITDWIISQHDGKAVICSVCAGTFMLAATGLLDQRSATTHWGLADEFSRRFPDVRLEIDKIVINDGDLITAGGIMAWIDLALELVNVFAGRMVMQSLAKRLVIDSGVREQRYYSCFTPHFDHADKVILRAQQFIADNYHNALSVAQLAELCCLSERMFLRRFVKATDLKPTEYMQRLRIQKACERIEASGATFDCVAAQVGYNDISAFRKIFSRITGLTPQEFKKRFVK